MPLPLVPLATVALSYGAVALATYAVTKGIAQSPRDQASEDALDKIDEGVGFRRDGEQVNGTGRIRRVVRFGADGPGLEIDVTALSRIRVRKV